jgi:hypothetical protein
MSTVYLAHHPSLPQWVALKVLPAELADNPALRARFVHEGDTTARLGHPNIVAVYGRGVTENGQLWIAMQYVSGTDAEAALRSGAMPPARALRIVDEVAKVLDHAHSRGVVHQDVKPSNILLGERGGDQERVVLSDFGAALTASSGDPADSPMVASLAYAAPEVITGGRVDGRADVYSLGCTLFRLLTGRYPFPVDGSMADTVTAHLRQDPPRPSEFLPWSDARLDRVIATALAKDPAHRYATAGQLAAAAHAAVATPIHARPRPATATRTLVIAAVAAIVVIIAAVVWLLLPASAPDPAAPSPAVTTSQAAPAREDLARLTRLLPAGYPPGSCRPAAADAGVAAVLSCGPNRDPGGPATATYALARTPEDLHAALERVIDSARTVICSGNIQSPGPWRHLATPAVTQGTVFCGVGDGRPLVAWTNDPQLLLATTQSQDANQLYNWWTAHS